MLQLLSITTDHTCMLRESQTLTQLFLLNHNYLLVPPPYYHLNTAKLLQGIKFIIFSDLHESFYYIPLEYLSYQDQIHNLCILPLLSWGSLTDISEALEQLPSSKDISEAHRVF